ncbi:hypothetical protein SDC9_179549 [bioreactor metagenome]|uniref:Uncharacterized protein n=1 Tax=bioreactor metagenome TaxID=1076179 RepID=A0A645H8G3_9ZZZZ
MGEAQVAVCRLGLQRLLQQVTRFDAGATLNHQLCLEQDGRLPVLVQRQGAINGGQRLHRAFGDRGRLGAGEVGLGVLQIRLGQAEDHRLCNGLVWQARQCAIEPHQVGRQIGRCLRQCAGKLGLDVLGAAAVSADDAG